MSRKTSSKWFVKFCAISFFWMLQHWRSTNHLELRHGNKPSVSVCFPSQNLPIIFLSVRYASWLSFFSFCLCVSHAQSAFLTKHLPKFQLTPAVYKTLTDQDEVLGSQRDAGVALWQADVDCKLIKCRSAGRDQSTPRFHWRGEAALPSMHHVFRESSAHWCCSC